MTSTLPEGFVRAERDLYSKLRSEFASIEELDAQLKAGLDYLGEVEVYLELNGHWLAASSIQSAIVRLHSNYQIERQHLEVDAVLARLKGETA